MKWRSQQRPQMPGYRHYAVDIASAELPCGASWIANVLLELDVPIWHPWGADTRAEWHCIGQRRFRYQRPDEGWRRLLPGLTDQRVFAFRKGPLPRVGHHWPQQYLPALPAILVVRDPRDALYSAWRRERKLGAIPDDLGFCEFVQAPFRGWPLSWSACFALHTQAWMTQIERGGGLVLRFEEFKAEPLREARRVMELLGLRVPSEKLQAAVSASDHSAVATAERDLLARGSVPTALLAGGEAQEWRTHYTPDMHRSIPQWLWSVFTPLGYEPEVAGGDVPTPDVSVLTAMEEQLLVPAGSAASRAIAEAIGRF